MIHYMGGGVLSEYGSYTFVKVVFDGSDAKPYWFISDFEVIAGDRVSAPYGVSGSGKPATVVKVEHNVSAQISPIPFKRAKRIICKIDE